MLQDIGIIVGVVCGVAGLVLGILNYLDAKSKTRPRLRVRPILRHVISEDEPTRKYVAMMEVCNVGNVPVIGEGIGFSSVVKGGGHHIIVRPKSLGGHVWPGEIQPGHVRWLEMNLDSLDDIEKLGLAYAATMVGDKFYCSKRELQEFKDEVRKAASRK